MEGGTDFDLQVLEAPTAPAVSGGELISGGGPEKSQGDPSKANVSGHSGSDSNRSRTEEATKRRKERGKEREKEAPAKPRPLHLTTSLFIRSIPPEVSKEEITAVRVCTHTHARCWVTFDRSLRDCELSPVVNRDLCRRVRSVNGLTHHKPVVRNDIRLSARLVHSLDQRGELWAGQVWGTEPMETNPVLRNITDYLIEEVSAEEEELMGASGGNIEDAGARDHPSDSVSLLLLYLRLVHSVDYYNFCEYPAEDEMPHRCGLIHVRGPLPVAAVLHFKLHRMCEQRLAPLLSPSETLSEEEAVKLGKKDPEQEVEKFLSANTQELSKDKWLCPLSGKKFKAPEFVRKHILNKHAEKVAAVRQEVEFFNNFLLDAKSLLGYPPGVRPPMPGFPGTQMYHSRQVCVCVCVAGGGPPYPPNQFGAGRGNYDNFRGHLGGGGGGMRGDPRSIIEYRDLDAPDDLDFF
uniref:SERRATE/Ars2 C-terminal domain-containing protein n=1 Tax=Monopterus albus TaxID=43700 RepID=A0A3Q3IRV0_MONAL